MSELSEKTGRILPSATLSISAKVKKLKAEGLDVVGFGAGEPDFDTPDYIKAEARKAIDEGFTKYTATSGIPELKKAIIEKLKKDNGLEYKESQIIVSCGAKHSLFNAVSSICNPGDEVILQSPYWVTYYEQIRLIDAVPVIIETSGKTGFKLTPGQLEKSITPKTKLLIINSPSNPTGAVYSRDELSAISEIAVRYNIYVISDEIYEKIIYDGIKHTGIASFGEKIRALTVVVNGVSKSHSMTGWRIGYSAGPEEIIKRMSNLQDHVTSNPDSIAQRAAWKALSVDDGSVEKMRAEFEKRRDFIVSSLSSIPGITCFKPAGAFYVFPDVSSFYGKKYKDTLISDCDCLCSLLLDRAQVACVPGSAFGAPANIRLSYATSMSNIEKGLQRLRDFFSIAKHI